MPAINPIKTLDIVRSLVKNNLNVSATADELGLTRNTVYNRMKPFGWPGDIAEIYARVYEYQSQLDSLAEAKRSRVSLLKKRMKADARTKKISNVDTNFNDFNAQFSDFLHLQDIALLWFLESNGVDYPSLKGIKGADSFIIRMNNL